MAAYRWEGTVVVTLWRAPHLPAPETRRGPAARGLRQVLRPAPWPADAMEAPLLGSPEPGERAAMGGQTGGALRRL